MKTEGGFSWKLGMFVTAGILLFAVGIYFVGKQKNLFGSTFRLKSTFKTVSGLKVGNNIRFSGINVGTIDQIELITDTSVLVSMVIKSEVRKFIKTDASAGIGSDGLMGEKVLSITPGNSSKTTVTDGSTIASKRAIEMDDIMTGVKTSVDNAAVITGELAAFSYKINHSNGVLTKMISDESFSNSLSGTLMNLQASTGEFAKFSSKLNSGKFNKALDSTMLNIQGATKGLNENMEAAKSNFLLRGYYRKKKKADLKKAAIEKKRIQANMADSVRLP